MKIFIFLENIQLVGWGFMMKSIKEIIANNNRITDLVNDLQQKIARAEEHCIENQKQELIKENEHLQELIEITKQELIDLEIQHNKPQIPLPNSNGINKDNLLKNPPTEITPTTESLKVNSNASKLETKKTKVKANKENVPNTPETPADIRRLDMRIGRIIEVKHHPDADTLYLEKIDCGEPTPRTVISGLVKYVPIEQMANRLVIILCNLKAVKMRGIASEAMVMCASTPEHVEILTPPANAEPGDLIYCQDYPREPDAVLNPKKKIFENCAPNLKTNNDGIACFMGAPLYIPNKGHIFAATLKNAPIK